MYLRRAVTGLACVLKPDLTALDVEVPAARGERPAVGWESPAAGGDLPGIGVGASSDLMAGQCVWRRFPHLVLTGSRSIAESYGVEGRRRRGDRGGTRRLSSRTVAGAGVNVGVTVTQGSFPVRVRTSSGTKDRTRTTPIHDLIVC